MVVTFASGDSVSEKSISLKGGLLGSELNFIAVEQETREEGHSTEIPERI